MPKGVIPTVLYSTHELPTVQYSTVPGTRVQRMQRTRVYSGYQGARENFNCSTFPPFSGKMGNSSTTNYTQGYEGQGVWEFGDDNGEMAILNVWKNGDISWCHIKAATGQDFHHICPCTGRVPVEWIKDASNPLVYTVKGSGLRCGFSTEQKCLKTVSTEMEAPADRSLTKELMTDTNVTVLKISDRSAGVSGVAHRSVTV